MLLASFTIFHVVISLVAILAGIFFTVGLVTSRSLSSWTGTFLATTIATNVTGFFFPVQHFMPSHGVGLVSLAVLGLAVFALYRKKLLGGWRKTFVLTAVMAFYLNVFVALVQAFGKIPALKQLAPTQTESPFKLAQLGLLAIFILVGTISALRFRGAVQPEGALS